MRSLPLRVNAEWTGSLNNPQNSEFHAKSVARRKWPNPRRETSPLHWRDNTQELETRYRDRHQSTFLITYEAHVRTCALARDPIQAASMASCNSFGQCWATVTRSRRRKTLG